MSRDRSLDEFVGGAGESTAAEADEDGGSDSGGDPDTGAESLADGELDGAEETDDEVEADGEEVPGPDLDGVEPAAATYRWDPDGVECPACGEVVERLWTREGDLVCASCKEW